MMLVIATLALARNATAQQTEPAADAMSIIMTTPSTTPSREVQYRRDLDDANSRILKIRNSLIGTSAGFAVGAIITGIGYSQCQVLERPNQSDELLCNTAGNVMVPMGGTIVGLAAIGMITSGIMLGVAKKRRREIERDYRRATYGRRLEWDPRGGLRF